MEEIIFLSSIATICTIGLVWLFSPWGKKWRRDSGML